MLVELVAEEEGELGGEEEEAASSMASSQAASSMRRSPRLKPIASRSASVARANRSGPSKPDSEGWIHVLIDG